MGARVRVKGRGRCARERNARTRGVDPRARARGGGTKNRADVETMETTGGRSTERGVEVRDGGDGGREWSTTGLFARKDADGESASEKGEKRAVWALGLLTAAYCHASATGFLLPSLLPVMSMDLKLDDGEGAVLTTLFTVTYSLLLPFVGVLADTVNRKNLLACGAATWTAASFMTAHSENFGSLVLSRGLFAIGNSPQNPVAFSMIPELFPRNKNIALSVYNLAIHAGRAVSFASGAFVGRAPLPPGADAHMFSNDPITLPLTYLTEIGSLGSAHDSLHDGGFRSVDAKRRYRVGKHRRGRDDVLIGDVLGTNLRHRRVARFGHRSSRVTHDQRSRAHGGGISNAAKSQEGDEEIRKSRREEGCPFIAHGLFQE